MTALTPLPLPSRFSTITEIILYVDAARDDYVSGLGYVIEGEVSRSGRRTLRGKYTSMEAEFHALVEGLRVASIESDARATCTAHSDCEPLIRKMRGNEVRRNDWQEYYESAHWLLGKFDEWELRKCRREVNEDAHELARQAMNDGRKS